MPHWSNGARANDNTRGGLCLNDMCNNPTATSRSSYCEEHRWNANRCETVECYVESCTNKAFNGKYSTGLCKMHRDRRIKYGTPTPVIVCEGCCATTIFDQPAYNSTRRYCLDCINLCERNKEWIDPRGWKGRFFHRYGLNLISFLKMLERQQYRCALLGCQIGIGKWCIDHDHSCCDYSGSCGECVRGIVCFRCNNILAGYETALSYKIAIEQYLVPST